MARSIPRRWRISSLPSLSRCPGFTLLGVDRPSSKAADTGSAVGRLIELWHRAGEDSGQMDACVQTLRAEAASRFALADLDDVVTTGLLYAQDPRNRGEVVADYCELQVDVTLPPAPEDPVGEPIQLRGHVDQIREVGGQLYVWDVKNGRPEGEELVNSYALQLAAYAVAATHTLGRDVLPGGIIRTQGYRATRRVRGDDGELRDRVPTDARVFYHAQWSLSQCRSMLGTAVQHVALLNAGIVLTQPGVHCRWCPADGPNVCGDEIERAFA